jgi:hypothetical protein
MTCSSQLYDCEYFRNKIQLSDSGLSGKVGQECRPMAVLEAAGFLSVALPAQLSLDLND